MRSEGFPFIVWGSGGWTRVRAVCAGSSRARRGRVAGGSLIPCRGDWCWARRLGGAVPWGLVGRASLLGFGTGHCVSGHVTSRNITSCHVTSCPVMSCHVMSCRVMLCHVVSCRVRSRHVMSYLVTSCHVLSRRLMLLTESLITIVDKSQRGE